MRGFFVFILVLAVAAGVVGYYRGWFTEADGKIDVNKEKFTQDKKAVSKKVGEEATTLKDKLDKLWEKTKAMTGDEQKNAQKELTELKEKHAKLVKQIEDLDAAGEDKFKDIEADLKKNLAEVDKRIDDLTKKLDKTPPK